MESPILTSIDPAVICIILFGLMLLIIAFGNSLRKKIGAEEGDSKGGVNSLLGALFGLWSFILAFTFSQSGTRFENVRGLIVEEATALRTTIIKADFFPDSVRSRYRTQLHNYLEERISYYENAMDEPKFTKNREELLKTGDALWATTVEQFKNPATNAAAANMTLTLTGLFDIAVKREALLKAGLPSPISLMLVFLALSICFVGGFTSPIIKRKEWVIIAVFALLASTVLYITIDLARPMQGLIKPDAGQAYIVNLRSFF